MAEADDAVRESEQARRRLTELANEIGRRATGDYVRNEARTLVREKTDEMRTLATEKTQEWTATAKETAVTKSIEYRDKAMGSPKFLGICGALLGAWAGRKLAKSGRLSSYVSGENRDIGRFGERGFDARYDTSRRYESDVNLNRDIGYGGGSTGINDLGTSGYAGSSDLGAGGYGAGGYGPGIGTPSAGSSSSFDTGSSFDMSGSSGADKGESLKNKASQQIGDIKEKASDVVDSAKEKLGDVAGRMSDKLHSARDSVGMKASHLRENMPSVHDVREKAGTVYREQPWAVAAGALACGLLAALLLPMTERERQAIEPMRSKAKDKLRDVGKKIEERVGASDESMGAGQGGESIERRDNFIGSESIVARREDLNEDTNRGEQIFDPPTVH